MFKLSADYKENGIDLKAGKYSKEQLIKLYGSEDSFNFCLKCTSLGKVLVEVKEGKSDKRVIENKAVLNGFQNKEEAVIQEEVQEGLTIEDYKKIADEKGVKYHPNIGLSKLKEKIAASE